MLVQNNLVKLNYVGRGLSRLCGGHGELPQRFYDVTSWSYVNLDDPVLQATGSWSRAWKRGSTFDCKGYREVLDSAVLSITGMIFLTRPHSQSATVNQGRVLRRRPICFGRILFTYTALAHPGVGGETCMEVLVTSADVKPRPWKLFPRPEGLRILSLLDPFPNPFRVLVLSRQSQWISSGWPNSIRGQVTYHWRILHSFSADMDR